MKKTLTKTFLYLALAATFCVPALAHDDKPAKPDRSPKNVGSVLVFGGTGWYRHPETAAISGWLARLSDELGMQVDVTESPKFSTIPMSW